MRYAVDAMQARIVELLSADDRIAYAILFGSRARGDENPSSDVDLALGLRPETELSPLSIGDLTARLEEAIGGRVDLVLLDEAPISLAYRVFRDGKPVAVTDREALLWRKVRAILDYLDFMPAEQLCARGVLQEARRGR